MLNPDTSSDSLSAKSKGVRLASAKAEINHIIAKGGLRRRTGQLKFFINRTGLKEILRTTGLSKMIANLTS